MSIEADYAKQHKGAAGLAQIKKGFCFDPVYDELFALGWPHMRLLSDVHVEPYKPALYHLMQTDFDLRLRWPRSLAIALVRAWGIGRLYDVSPGQREIREEVKEALWNLEDLTDRDCAELIKTRMEKTPFWIGDRATESFVLLAEALTSAKTVGNAIVEALESFDYASFFDMQPMAALITYQLGYMLLRMPEADAVALRARIEKLLDGITAMDNRVPGNPCHARSMMLVLRGAQAAHDTTDHDLRWYTHSGDPVAVRMRASINKGFTLPDARLVWIGGPRILNTSFGTLYTKLDSTDQRWFLEQISPIKAPEVVPLVLDLNSESTIRAHARAWLLEHKDFALPIVERLAGVSNPHAAEARAFLASLG